MKNSFDFEFELSSESLKKFKRTVEEYQKALEDSKKDILEALASYTQERIIKHIGETVGQTEGKYVDYIPTDELINNIKISDIADDMVRVIADTDCAKFVEFGTGYAGQRRPSEKASEMGWNYSSKSHIYEDKLTGEKRELQGWYYRGSDGNVYFTEGLPAHNFMYNSWLDLKNNYRSIVKQVLRERGLI